MILRTSFLEESTYGFQGQEKDDEIKGAGNSINYKYRMHDPRLGRFFAVDPLAAKYPHYSPYSFSGNRLLDAIEFEGLEDQLIYEEQSPAAGGTPAYTDITVQEVWDNQGNRVDMNVRNLGSGQIPANGNQTLTITKDNQGIIQDPTPNNNVNNIGAVAGQLTADQAAVKQADSQPGVAQDNLSWWILNNMLTPLGVSLPGVNPPNLNARNRVGQTGINGNVGVEKFTFQGRVNTGAVGNQVGGPVGAPARWQGQARGGGRGSANLLENQTAAITNGNFTDVTINITFNSAGPNAFTRAVLNQLNNGGVLGGIYNSVDINAVYNPAAVNNANSYFNFQIVLTQ